jgi:enhancing lycopene biosynthesis protein 2
MKKRNVMNKEKKFAVILSGCGVLDGAEIHESVMTLYAIAKNGGVYEVFAPDIQQLHVVNHYNQKEMPGPRNVLIESARIARGRISPLSKFNAANFDALIFPGGFGVAKNLCDYAFKDADCTVNEEVAAAIRSMAKAGKPIGALCISPVLLAKVLENVTVTLGNDPASARSVEKMGALHKITTHGQVVIDEKHKLVTSPCYMLDANIIQISEGIDHTVKVMMELMK